MYHWWYANHSLRTTPVDKIEGQEHWRWFQAILLWFRQQEKRCQELFKKTVKTIVDVNRVPDRDTSLKVEVEDVILKIAKCQLEDKEDIWSQLDKVVDGVPSGERAAIGADFNGHGKRSRGDEEVLVRYGVKDYLKMGVEGRGGSDNI